MIPVRSYTLKNDMEHTLVEFSLFFGITHGTELQRSDPTLQLLGMRHDGKYLEEGSVSWDVPKRGRFRTRFVRA